ncbi:unnamed protein product, partial [Symbiodinium pilosum]
HHKPKRQRLRLIHMGAGVGNSGESQMPAVVPPHLDSSEAHGGKQARFSSIAAEAQRDHAQAQEAQVGQAGYRPSRSLDRQSGVQGICWHRSQFCWQLQVQQLRKRHNIHFPIGKFLQQGLGEEEAVAAALCEAKAHREELVHKGILKAPKAKHGKHSMVRGVSFDKCNQKWRVGLSHPITQKRVLRGRFAAQEEAEATARELAKELGIKEVEGHVVRVKKLCELKHFEPLGPEVGVKWSLLEQCWRGRCRVNGKQKHKRFRPKDLSEKEVGNAWKQAVAWRKQQEKERDQAKESPGH